MHESALAIIREDVCLASLVFLGILEGCHESSLLRRLFFDRDSPMSQRRLFLLWSHLDTPKLKQQL